MLSARSSPCLFSLPLLHPAAFQQGTGKTLVVRALAKEAGCRMLIISPSDVMDMAKSLLKPFSRSHAVSRPVFLDVMDALFGARVSGRESGGAFAHRGVITEFMQEMDGLKSSKEDRVIVIGATNRPFDLDDAVLRRVPRRLLVDLPGEKEQILKILLRDDTESLQAKPDAPISFPVTDDLPLMFPTTTTSTSEAPSTHSHPERSAIPAHVQGASVTFDAKVTTPPRTETCEEDQSQREGSKATWGFTQGHEHARIKYGEQ
ncbi:AAA-domain-containing protein [Suillus brevipes Sb2]|nr:AAA-domain-containing protein [Suillus brevipes Sb2]